METLLLVSGILLLLLAGTQTVLVWPLDAGSSATATAAVQSAVDSSQLANQRRHLNTPSTSRDALRALYEAMEMLPF